MTTQNKAVTCYLPKDIEDFITGYCNEYGITRKDREGNIYPSLGTGIIELLKLLAYNPELVSSPLLDTVPSKFSEDAIEKKIDEILEKKLNSPNTVPSQLPDLSGKVESIILDKLPSMIPEYLPSDLMGRVENMERLLKLQQSASIASPLPPSLPPDEPVRPAIETLTPEVPPSPPSPALEAIETVRSETDSIESVTGEAVDIGNRQGLTNAQLSEKTSVPVSTIEKWKGRVKIGEPIDSKKYPDFFKQWSLNLDDSLWYQIN
jgi:hypothetical protein